MDASVSAYIKRQSSQRLLHFLEQCYQEDSWYNYAQAVPEVLSELVRRDVEIPKNIFLSWNEYLQKKEKI